MTMEMIGIAIGSAVTGAVLMWMVSSQEDEDPTPVNVLGNCDVCKGWGYLPGWPDPSIFANLKCAACLGIGSRPKPGYLADKPAEEKTS